MDYLLLACFVFRYQCVVTRRPPITPLKCIYMRLLSMLNWAQPAKPNVNTIMSNYHPIYLPHILHFTPHLASHTHTHTHTLSLSLHVCISLMCHGIFIFLFFWGGGFQSEAKKQMSPHPESLYRRDYDRQRPFGFPIAD